MPASKVYFSDMRTGPDTLRVSFEGKTLEAKIEASAPWSLVGTTLEGNPQGGKWKALTPKRIAIRLDTPAAQGAVRVRFRASGQTR